MRCRGRISWTVASIACLAALGAGKAYGATQDGRETFEATFYSGLAIDTFASAQLNQYINPEDSGDIKERFVGGFNFQGRLAGRQSSPQQVWLYGRTTYGMRSADVDCKADPSIPVCSGFNASSGQTLYIIRNSTSLEAFLGLRYEFLRLQRNDKIAPAMLYLDLQAGFLTIARGGGDVVDVHHGGIGVVTTAGRYQGTHLQVGFGRTDLFVVHPKDRWKVDGYLTWRFEDANNPGQYHRAAPFVEMTVDADAGRGSDSVQTYLGMSFDLSAWTIRPVD